MNTILPFQSPISVSDAETRLWAPESPEGPPSQWPRPLDAAYPIDSPHVARLDAPLLGGLHPLRSLDLLDVDSRSDSPAAVVAAARHLTLEAAAATCEARRDFAPSRVSLDAQSQPQVSCASEGWLRRRRMKRPQAAGAASAGLPALGRRHSCWVDLLNGGQSLCSVVPNDESALTRWGSFWACPPVGRAFRPSSQSSTNAQYSAICGTAIDTPSANSRGFRNVP